MSTPSFAADAFSADLSPIVVRDLAKAYADRVVLDGIDLTVPAGRVVALIGENGSGKSTLLRIVAGQDHPDGGTVLTPRDLGWLPQDPQFPPDATVGSVLAEVLAPLHDAVAAIETLGAALGEDPDLATTYADTLEWAQQHEAWDADRRAEVAAYRLGLGALDRDRPVAELSGGERTRLALAALVTRRPTALLLDEPTNHLDDNAFGLVEDLIAGTPGPVLLASHDRVLLDAVADEVVDLDPAFVGADGGLGGSTGRRYTGTFTDYLATQADARRRWEEAYAAQQDELDRLREAERTTARRIAPGRGPRDNDKFIHAFKGQNVERTAARRVHAVERQIEAIQRDPVPRPPRRIAFTGALTRVGETSGAVVWVRDLVVPGRVSLERLTVQPGEHWLVTGANGSGKSSLLKVLIGQVAPAGGTVEVHAQRVGYLPQEVTYADPHLSAYATYRGLLRSALGADGLATAPNLGELGLVHPRDLRTPVGALSTGQQRRLALALVIALEPDLLLLDEPTNHLSLALAGELEDALGRSPGAVVLTSHDRWLRRRWSGPTLDLASPLCPTGQ